MFFSEKFDIWSNNELHTFYFIKIENYKLELIISENKNNPMWSSDIPYSQPSSQRNKYKYTCVDINLYDYERLSSANRIGRNRFNLYKREYKRTCFTHEIKSISNMKTFIWRKKPIKHVGCPIFHSRVWIMKNKLWCFVPIEDKANLMIQHSK